MTKIEWTNHVWNPVSGCTKVSEACLHCYAETMANRLSGMPQTKEKYEHRFQVTLHPSDLTLPYHWKSGMVFVVSMGDLFHTEVPVSFIWDVMHVIKDNPQLTFQILTKRADNMRRFFSIYKVPQNVWLGVTCETASHYDRIDALRQIKHAPVRFVSAEPLLGDMSDIDLTGIHWLITGGETGARARRSDPCWFRRLRDRCLACKVPFFFKAWGAWGEDGIKRSKEANGHFLDGQEWLEYPK